MIRVAVLVSGRGTNLQALLDHRSDTGDLRAKRGETGAAPGKALARRRPTASRSDYRIVLVCSNREGVPALERARGAGVPARVFAFADRAVAQSAMGAAVRDAGADLVVLAGFDRILVPAFFAALGDIPVISTHPSLLPRFGGRGMIGRRVHEAVLAAGERESGCTIFRVAPDALDEGAILLQRRVPVLPDDTLETLEARVLEAEHAAIVEAVRLFL